MDRIMPSFIKSNLKLLCTLIIVFIVSLSCVRLYTVTELGGDFDKHMLPSEMFGVPKLLQERNFKSLYKLPGQTGWDGQFYYYISNDLLGVTDVPKHVDSNAYRYQRIGLPLLANVFSKLLLQSYVSPTVYYTTSLLLILFATFLLARYLESKGCSPFLSLFWSLGIGVQLTLLNGLPDAAADSLLIIAILMWIRKKHWMFSIFATLAALSREAYILLPFILFAYTLANNIKNHMLFNKKVLLSDFYFIFPGIIFLFWQIYIRVHFGVSPSSQASNILNYPFVSFLKYFYLSFTGAQPLYGNHSASELVYLIYFILLIFVTFKTLISSYKKINHAVKPVSATFITLIFLYMCFGDTVMMDYTGYMKASTIFFFAIIFNNAETSQKISRKLFVFLIIGFLIFNSALIKRIHPDYISIQETIKVDNDNIPEKAACNNDYKYNVKLLHLTHNRNSLNRNSLNSLMLSLIGKGYTEKAKILLTNTSSKQWPLTKGFGSVNMSYQWVTDKGKVVQDGRRTFLSRPLNPGESIEMDMSIVYSIKNNAKLILSPVQEGCAWFYMAK